MNTRSEYGLPCAGYAYFSSVEYGVTEAEKMGVEVKVVSALRP